MTRYRLHSSTNSRKQEHCTIKDKTKGDVVVLADRQSAAL
jgi:hypothetical protein